MQAFGSRRFTVPRGRQICGLHFEARKGEEVRLFSSSLPKKCKFMSREGSTIASVTTCPEVPKLRPSLRIALRVLVL